MNFLREIKIKSFQWRHVVFEIWRKNQLLLLKQPTLFVSLISFSMSTIVVFLLGIENLRFGDAEDYLNAAIAINNF